MKASPKVHVTINGNDRSICGMSPRHGNYDIRTMATFFQAPESDQCGRCLDHLAKRGYSITKLRADAKFLPRKDVVVDRCKVICQPDPWHQVHRMSDDEPRISL